MISSEPVLLHRWWFALCIVCRLPAFGRLWNDGSRFHSKKVTLLYSWEGKVLCVCTYVAYIMCASPTPLYDYHPQLAPLNPFNLALQPFLSFPYSILTTILASCKITALDRRGGGVVRCVISAFNYFRQEFLTEVKSLIKVRKPLCIPPSSHHLWTVSNNIICQ